MTRSKPTVSPMWIQVGVDNGARRALIPLKNNRNLLEVSDDIVERVDPLLLSDPMTAAMRSLGLSWRIE
jgi:ATP-dependent Lon protease